MVDAWCTSHEAHLIHGDFWPENLIWTGDRAVAIDWHEMRKRPHAMELAWAAYECTREEASPVLDTPRIRLFVDTYADAGGHVPAGFEQTFIPFIRTTMRENLRAVLAIPHSPHEAWTRRETRCFQALKDQRLV